MLMLILTSFLAVLFMLIVDYIHYTVNSYPDMCMQLRWFGPASKERHSRVDQHTESVAVQTHQKPLSDQGREDHVSNHHENDTHTGIHAHVAIVENTAYITIY